MQNNKNLIVFFVLSMVIFLGWAWLQEQIWPRPKPRPKTPESEANLVIRPKPQEELWAGLPALALGALGQAPAGLGLSAPSQLLGDLAALHWFGGDPRRPEKP